ncbi:MAG: hypothetical protein JWO33_1717 [Caulobacteraceae bacterium]|nr:hypothetical protein [Caulobacteraceae bacterium]
MSVVHHHRSEQGPAGWAIGLLAFSILALLGAFTLLAVVP